MKVLYVASEVAPYVKTGGPADVAGSLPSALKNNGVDIAVVCPLYSQIPDEWRKKMKKEKEIAVQLAWRSQSCTIYSLQDYGGERNITAYFIGNDYYFDREQVSGEYDDAERYAFFCHAVLDMIPAIGLEPDIIHCNDWQTAMVPVYFNLYYRFASAYAKIKTVFTIHNIAEQGRFGEDITGYILGIDRYHFDNGFLQHNGVVNFMKAAIVCSDYVTTVSPTFAKEIQTSFAGFTLDPVLQWYSGKLSGIMNGLNTKYYDPEIDPHLFQTYNAKTLEKKKVNRKELLKLVGLEADENTMVVGMVSELTMRKGIDLVVEAIDDMMEMDIRLIILGKGEKQYNAALKAAAKKYPDKIVLLETFDNDLSNKIVAGSDLVLYPSLYEACGLGQMIAMRYGTIPLVRETGGLKDSVTPYNRFTGTGNGFSFTEFSAHDMAFVLAEALDVFKNNKLAWHDMQVACMNGDYSWSASAKKYIEVYEKVLG